MSRVFISYRRQDSGPSARHIAAECASRYGEQSIFIDTDSIRMGDHWGDKINQALHGATVLLIVIGPDWLRTHDEYGRRRIDNEADWVRNEVLHGLSSAAHVIPVRVSGARTLVQEALPAALVELVNIQNYEMSDAHWQRDMQVLFKALEAHGLTVLKQQAKYIYPPKIDESASLTPLEIEQYLKELPGWEVKKLSENSEGKAADAMELHRHYAFHSFNDCVHFMMTASRMIAKMQHHPRWENMWINLNVYLTTWDIGKALSYKDIRLALYLDELFKNYKRAAVTTELFPHASPKKPLPAD